MMTKRGLSKTKTRCQDGWRLFFKIGDIYTYNVTQPVDNRDWSDHLSAIKVHKEHVEGCSICNNGLKELQLTLEEMAVEGVS